MSLERHCEIYKTDQGKWFLDLAPDLHGSWRDAQTYGPFPTEKAADDYLGLFANPGSMHVDASGTKPTPTKSPNGRPVLKTSSLRQWARW